MTWRFLALAQVWGEKKRTTSSKLRFAGSPHSIGAAEKLPSWRPFVLTTPAMTRPGPPAESRVAWHGYKDICDRSGDRCTARLRLGCEGPSITPPCSVRVVCIACCPTIHRLRVSQSSLAVWPGTRRRRCTRRAPARPRRARSGAPPGKFMRMPDFFIVATQSRL